MNNEKRKTEKKRMAARAPYNFVPLNEVVINAPEKPVLDKFYNYSGYIELEIETITPLFIGSNEKNSKFFSPTGKPRIPGSTLRGMIRTLVEIVSYGKFGFCDKERRLYFRAVAGNSSLDKNYRKLFFDIDKRVDIYKRDNHIIKYKFKAGVMKKEGNSYRIYPSKVKEGTQIYRIEHSNLPDELKSKKPYHFEVVYYQPVKEKEYKHKHETKNKNLEIYLKYAKINSVALSADCEHPQKGYLVISGELGTKKHMHWIINEPEQDKYIEIPSKIIKEYERDNRRDERFNVLKKLSECGEVPVFYLTDKENNIIAFGHTGFFRLPYDYTIGDYIPPNLKSEDIIDFAEVIFGKVAQKDSFASRVFFEDAELIGQGKEKQDVFLSETSPKILSEPKPTAFQHYLEQPDGVNTSKENLYHWNTKGANIRGYKLYWHRNAPDNSKEKYSWNEGVIKKDSTQHTVIKPIKRGIKFKSRIRFENLSKEELGCLLFVLDLPENHYHKIGKAKPLGLGTVKIKPILFIVDRKKRYMNLFNNDEWELGITKKDNIDEYKKCFEEYMLQKLKQVNIVQGNLNSLWDTDRLKELKKILSWENNNIYNWMYKTHYMELNEFKDRPVLPKPSEVK